MSPRATSQLSHLVREATVSRTSDRCMYLPVLETRFLVDCKTGPKSIDCFDIAGVFP